MAAAANITRRHFLKSTPSVAAAVAIPVGVASGLPSEVDLTRYYAFLWMEMQALSAEMGVRMLDAQTAHRNGDVDALEVVLASPPSRRARPVLALLA